MFELRPYQEPIAGIVFDYMRKHPGKHPLVALPTGAGKTVVMADIIKQATDKWPETKVLVISHVREILTQDYNALKFHLNKEIGLYSAGLKSRSVKDITVAGIQSIYKSPQRFADYKLIIIDECHLIPPVDTSMYRRFFGGLIAPRYFGLTATPFRLGSGLIYGDKDSIFDDLVYDLTSAHKFVKLIEDGYLSKLSTKATQTRLDTKNIATRGGDFDKKEMADAFNIEAITREACKEIVKAGEGYKKWLIFAIDIAHAESIAETLISMGVPSMVVHSKMDMDRDWVIDQYKIGSFKAMVNVNVLTTGFDDPEIDLIALLRPTQSPVIHVQTIGRGLRIADGKDHCLVLDFAGNTERLGPINDIVVRKRRKGQEQGEGEAPTKECPKCNEIVPISTKICPSCQYAFPIITKLQTRASNAEIISTRKPIDWYDVKDIVYNLHIKDNKPDMIKVSYLCGSRYFNEFICIEHPANSYAKRLADHWVKYRGGKATNAKELFEEKDVLKRPTRIKVDTRGKYPNIVDAEFANLSLAS